VATEPKSSRSRRPILVVLTLFALPLAAAFLLIYTGVWRPAGSTEHGNLIHPARPLPEIALHDAEGNLLAKSFLQERWSLVYVGDGQCDAHCRAALADMQRARELLGKEISRTQLVFFASDHCCDLAALHAVHPKLTIARVDEESAAALLAMFPQYDNVPTADAGRIYIVDPHGNLMMSYPRDASGIGMYQDLKKLLELSHIG
jgi:cytochrome oxidase Cu insertion factor (SCO1/SenC/PrrC family)